MEPVLPRGWRAITRPFTPRARSHGGPVHTEGPFTPRARSHRGPVHTEGPLQNTTLPTMDATCESSGPSPAPTLSYWGRKKGRACWQR